MFTSICVEKNQDEKKCVLFLMVDISVRAIQDKYEDSEKQVFSLGWNFLELDFFRQKMKFFR